MWVQKVQRWVQKEVEWFHKVQMWVQKVLAQTESFQIQLWPKVLYELEKLDQGHLNV